MRRVFLPFVLAAVVVAQCSSAWAEPVFVNGLVFPGNTLAATRQPGANGGRLGFFSDIYYDPNRDEWWAVSDRGPGGGVLDYATRVQRFTIDVHPLLCFPTRPSCSRCRSSSGLTAAGWPWTSSSSVSPRRFARWSRRESRSSTSTTTDGASSLHPS